MGSTSWPFNQIPSIMGFTHYFYQVSTSSIAKLHLFNVMRDVGFKHNQWKAQVIALRILFDEIPETIIRAVALHIKDSTSKIVGNSKDKICQKNLSELDPLIKDAIISYYNNSLLNLSFYKKGEDESIMF